MTQVHSIGLLVTACVAACAAIMVLARLAPRLGLVDHPGGRKRHHAIVPLVGGFGIYIGVVIACLVWDNVGALGDSYKLACGAMLLVGVADDRHDITPTIRLALQTAIAVTLVLVTGHTVPDLGNLLGFGTLNLGWLALPFTIVAMVALINAFNMLDGLDGLAGGVGFVGFGALAVLSTVTGQLDMMTVTLAFVGALLGFLFFNAPLRLVRRRLVFMGDAGSTLLGFAFAACALTMVSPQGGDVPPPLILWLVAIPIFELFSSTYRRAARGMSPMEADLGHYHHRLLEAGWPVNAVFAFYFLFSAVSAGIGLTMYALHAPDWVTCLGFVAWFAMWNVVIVQVPRERRRRERRRERRERTA